uniref:Invertebrate defensins family profile domain-containing protein n=1 Tax=Strigamia maritima TaxID=126957 RepID=T1IN58_STRMM
MSKTNSKILIVAIYLIVALSFAPKVGSAEISWQCTTGCTAWHACRSNTLFMGRCKFPDGCDCSKVAWEG